MVLNIGQQIIFEYIVKSIDFSTSWNSSKLETFLFQFVTILVLLLTHDFDWFELKKLLENVRNCGAFQQKLENKRFKIKQWTTHARIPNIVHHHSWPQKANRLRTVNWCIVDRSNIDHLNTVILMNVHSLHHLKINSVCYVYSLVILITPSLYSAIHNLIN